MEESLLEIVPRLEKRTHYLSSLANIGMLIGLLGTIVALIHAFATVSQANPAEKAALLAAAISEAMNNTAMGLGCRDHAAAVAHVPRSQDHVADRQPGDRGGEVPEFDHGAIFGAGRSGAGARHGAARPGSASCLIASYRYLAKRQELTRWPRQNSPPARCAIMRSTAAATTSTSCR